MPDKPRVAISGDLQAQISGVSRGTDISLVVFGIICLVGTLGCFWLTSWTPWATLGAVTFLAGFAYVLYVWRQGTVARTQVETPPAQLTWKSSGDEVALSIPLDAQNVVAAKKMLAAMRAMVHGREQLPAPRGRVVGSSADSKSLQEYSESDLRNVEQKWAEEVAKHDKEVVDQLEAVLQSPLDFECGNQPLLESSGVKVPQLSQPDAKTPAQ